jgi:hypothetical protein
VPKAEKDLEESGEPGKDDDQAGKGEAFRWGKEICFCHTSQSYEKICGQAATQHKENWFCGCDSTGTRKAATAKTTRKSSQAKRSTSKARTSFNQAPLTLRAA